jgi:putative ubiquitin-RnfH superfamily antitoxin RatB of RatAB toxin-antitoxin module
VRIGIVLARARAFESWEATVPQGATVEDAMRAAGLTPEWLQAQGIDALALHGVRCDAGTRLNEGDRIELLRPLVADPKDARRVRASRAGTRKAP